MAEIPAKVKELIRQGDRLFQKRQTLMSLWQTMADHFYVERADFTVSRTLGADFAEHLMTSFPLLCSRELGGVISSMCRPMDKTWFSIGTTREDRLDNDGRVWLQDKTTVMRRAMYDRASQFHRALPESDRDFAVFGNAVISVEFNRKAVALLYRTWHLRDVVWKENIQGKVDTVHRKWKPTADELEDMFADNIAPEVKKAISDDKPDTEFECRHIVMPSEDYEETNAGKKIRQPFVSIYVDSTNNFIMEEAGSTNLIYVIPRWQTVSKTIGGTQYGFSPATVAALPDARLIQAMTRTLLEAGEKYTNPPLIATQEMVRSDVNTFAGGITWVDADYDERLGEVLRPITQNQHGFPFGVEAQKQMQLALRSAFFLDKVNLPMPTDSKEMTAFEVGQRLQEYIRGAMPLFGPMETEYNGGICDISFDLLQRGGAFGSPMDMPPSLRGAEIHFKFISPLTDAIEAQKGQQLMQLKALLAQVADLDPSVAKMVDASTAFRDAAYGIGSPARWLLSEKDFVGLKQQADQAAATQALIANMGGAGAAAKNIGDAGQSLAAAGLSGGQPGGIVGPPTRQ